MIAGTLAHPPTTVAELIPPELAARLDSLDILSRKLLSGKLQGERRSKRRGRSVEFDDYREYVAGDDPRHIDWNVLARLDRFFIKIFQEEEDLALHLVLDTTASMNAGEPDACNKLLFAARLAAALGYIGLVNNNRVVLSIMGPGGLKQMEPLRGRRGSDRMTQFLLQNAFAVLNQTGVVGASSPADRRSETKSQVGIGDGDGGGGRNTRNGSTTPTDAFADAMKRISQSASGKGVLAVISDFLIPPPTGYEPGLRFLAAAAGGAASSRSSAGMMDVFLLQTLAPTELDPFANTDSAARDRILGDLRLLDAESSRHAEVTITPELVAHYRASVQAYIARLHAFATARGMTHQLVSTDASIATLVVDTLRRRGLLK